MERIKQAMDRARTERVATGGMPADAIPITNSTGASLRESIQYSTTRTETLYPHVLKNNRIICGDHDRIGLTAYKMLRTQVLQRMTARGWNTLGITSPAPGDGKTLTAINLAISLAREYHHTVLLVDTDLRNPSIHKYLGLDISVGLSDYLRRDAPLSEILINPGIERLVLLPGHERIENSSEVLASPAMGALVQELKTRYPTRLVLFDLPPILSADDALSFRAHIDAFLLVLMEGKTDQNDLSHAMEIMQDATILGTVLNGSREKLSAYY
jgi:protein-tyrosine kinase